MYIVLRPFKINCMFDVQNFWKSYARERKNYSKRINLPKLKISMDYCAVYSIQYREHVFYTCYNQNITTNRLPSFCILDMKQLDIYVSPPAGVIMLNHFAAARRRYLWCSLWQNLIYSAYLVNWGYANFQKMQLDVVIHTIFWKSTNLRLTRPSGPIRYSILCPKGI